MKTSFCIRLSIAMLLALGVFAQNSLACPARIQVPRPNEPERYSQIFIGRIKKIEPIDSMLSHSDLTPPYKLTLIEPATLVGEKFEGEIVNVGAGCGWPLPKMGVMAIFFVEKSGKMIIPGYGKDESDNFNLLARIEY